MFKFVSVIVACVLTLVLSEFLEFEYHSNEELEIILRNFSEYGNPDLRKNLYHIGYSSGRPKSYIKPSRLWVLELTAAPVGKIGVPNVKLVGNIHGSEPVGRELLLHFIQHLLKEYGRDEHITWLLNNTRIHILPNSNPDGFAVANKFYCNSCSDCLGMGATDDDILINSNFPDNFHTNEVLEYTAETLALMKWMEDVNFILSGSFFGSFMVAIYPYCNRNESFDDNATPDDDVFQHLAKTYSNNHSYMHKGQTCPKSTLQFKGGIVNGASWHHHDSDMTDYNYIFRGCMEVRLEISCCKYPEVEMLQNLWNDNKNALTEYCKQANRGVTGQILDMDTKNPVEATLKIVGREMEFTNFKQTGEFFRILLPGNYTLQVKADGYYPMRVNFTVMDAENGFPKLTNLTLLLLNSSISTTPETTLPPPTTMVKITETIVNTKTLLTYKTNAKKLTVFETNTEYNLDPQIRVVRHHPYHTNKEKNITDTDFACCNKQGIYFIISMIILILIW